MGSFLSRALLMVFGYAYPAYKCFKIVEKDQPRMEQLLFWCQYWILVAFATVCERVGDPLVSWLPLYDEAKLAFFIYLWHDKTNGTEYIYSYFCRDILSKHEDAIDRNLHKLRNRAGNLAVFWWQNATTYGLTRFFETFQYASIQLPSLHQGDRIDANEENQSDSRRELESGFESSAMASGDDGEATVLGQHVSEGFNPGQSKDISLQDVKSLETGKLKGCLAAREDVKTGMFRAAMNRLRRRKSPHRV